MPGTLLVYSLSVCPSASLSVILRFSGLFSVIFSDIDLQFGSIWYMNLSWHNTEQVRVLLRLTYFYTPVFRRDVLWYGDVCPSVRVSVRPTLRPSVRPGLRPPVFHTFLHHALTYWAEILHMTLFYCTTDQIRVSSISVKFCASYAPFVTYNTGNTQFSALYSYMLWHIELKLCIRLCFTVLQIKFEYCQFASIFVGVMSLLKLTILEIHNLRQFLCELCPFWNLQYWKYTVFRTFLQHALIYWAEILNMTLVYCTKDQVPVSSLCVNFCGSYAPFGTYNTGNTQFSAIFSYMFWHIELKFCTWLCYTVLQIKFECRQFPSSFVRVMPLL